MPSIPLLLLPLTPAHARQHDQRLGEHALDAVAKTLIMVAGGVGRGMYPRMYPRPKAARAAAQSHYAYAGRSWRPNPIQPTPVARRHDTLQGVGHRPRGCTLSPRSTSCPA